MGATVEGREERSVRGARPTTTAPPSFPPSSFPLFFPPTSFSSFWGSSCSLFFTPMVSTRGRMRDANK